MVESIERGVQLLMNSIDCMQACTHETSFTFEDFFFEESIVNKQLDYFKCKDKVTNENQMSMKLQGDKNNQSLFPKQDYDEHNKNKNNKVNISYEHIQNNIAMLIQL